MSSSALTISEQVCYALARGFLNGPLKRCGFRTPAKQTHFESMESYLADRVSVVSVYQQLFERFASFSGKTVLDLGCSRGYLLNSFLQTTPFTAIGADTNEAALVLGREKYGKRIEFVQNTPTSIPLHDASIDVVYTIDTVEHLTYVKEVFLEVFRVLKPGGIFLIHFNPWLNPYGSHLEDIIPFPWPHVVFSMKTLLKVAAKLYDSPLYQVACYWIDPQTGKKQPNPYLDHSQWEGYLNHMTIKRFNRLCTELPFEKRHQGRIGFGGNIFKIARLFRGLAHVPFIDEFFCSALFTVLLKPETTGSVRNPDLS